LTNTAQASQLAIDENLLTLHLSGGYVLFHGRRRRTVRLMSRRSTSKSGKPAKVKVTAADEFEFAIKTKTGQVIETVSEAFAYIEVLPEKTQRRPEWQLAIRELHRAVAEDRAWLFFARMGINRAIHGTAPPISKAGRKKANTLRERRRARKAAARWGRLGLRESSRSAV